MNSDFPILAYHKVDYRRELGITNLSPERFERQISFFKESGYSSFLTDEFPNISSISLDGINMENQDYESGESSNSPSRFFIISFDDGYEDIFIYAYPILKKYGFTAIVFLIAGYIGKFNIWDASPGPRFRHLNWTQVQEMSKNGFLFGSHGINHNFLTRQKDNDIRYETETSKKMLEDRLGLPVQFFSYPYGNYNERVIRFVHESGYKAAFSLYPEFWSKESYKINRSIYAIPRIAIYSLDNMRAFRAKIGCSRSGQIPYMQKIKNQLINKCAYASVLVKNQKS